MAEICPICGHGIMTAVVCPRYGRAVHMDHCPECEYHQALTWGCSYTRLTRAETEKPSSKATVYNSIASLYDSYEK